MKNTLKIEIPNPCKANWEKMSLNDIGRHCTSCNTTVVDFTKMTDDEIVKYLSSNSTQNTCGHFLKGQIKNDKNSFQLYFYNLYEKAHFKINNRFLRFATLVLLGGILILSGCNTPTKGKIENVQEQTTVNTVAPQTNDSATKNSSDTVQNQK